MKQNIILEKEACQVSKEASKPPLIFELPIEQGRKILEDTQRLPINMYPAIIYINQIDTIGYGIINVYTIKPNCYIKPNNIILYLHGAGWVFGSFHTHEKLVRELAYRTNSVIVFPEYTRAPEATFPIAINQCYVILNKIQDILKINNINANMDTLTVAGDSVGGNMTIAITLISKFQNGPKIHKQLLYYPVTDNNFCTDSYIKFAYNYYLYRDGMKWFWNKYNPCSINSILATPLKASTSQLQNLPDALIINGEADVLKDDGKAYANKLRDACNNVTHIEIQGTIHDFVMLNSLDQTKACRIAMDISTSWINSKNRHTFQS